MLGEILSNRVLMAGITAWATAQVLKTIINAILTKEFSAERLFGDGGMPSAHSATVSAMAMMSLMNYGAGSFEFAISAMLAIIVMHDAMGVRLETGKQAMIINDIMDYLEKKDFTHGLPQEDLKELVGHTPIQVIAGCLLGLLIGFIMH